MDEATAHAMKVDTHLIIDDPVRLSEDPALSDPNLPMGETGTGGVWETKAKTHAQEVEETKRENEAVRERLRNGIKLTDKKYLPRAGVKLSKVAPRVFAAVRANPPDWLDEFDAFVAQTIGKCPSHTVRTQAANEWDAAVMFGLLTFGYFAEMLNDEMEHEQKEAANANPEGEQTAVQPVEGSAGGDSPAPDAGTDSADAGAADDAGAVNVTPPTKSVIINPNTGTLGDAFAVLGPDGEPLIEKLR